MAKVTIGKTADITLDEVGNEVVVKSNGYPILKFTADGFVQFFEGVRKEANLLRRLRDGTKRVAVKAAAA